MFRILGGSISAKIDYLSGHYKRASLAKSETKTISYKIGGLVFTGQHQEARVLYESFSGKLSTSDLIVARFHIGISYTRTSDYKKAEECFEINKQIAEEQSVSGIAGFYAYQGISFLRFFFSEHSESQKFAEKGYAFLLLMDHPPPLLMSLSLDIQGHNKIQMGEINQGLEVFKKALKITKNNKLKDLHSEIFISYLMYKSDFDVDLDSNITILKKHLKKTSNTNDFKCPELVLQISKLLFLKGEFFSANEFLRLHFDHVYKNQNKRKIAVLNTLIAQFMIYRGQNLEALSIINVAQDYLNENIDRSLYLPLLGLKIMTLSLLQRENSNERTLTKLNLLTRWFQMFNEQLTRKFKTEPMRK